MKACVVAKLNKNWSDYELRCVDGIQYGKIREFDQETKLTAVAVELVDEFLELFPQCASWKLTIVRCE